MNIVERATLLPCPFCGGSCGQCGKMWDAEVDEAHHDSCQIVKNEAALATLTAPPTSEERLRAIDDIAAERRRQVDAEGWTSEHDDEHGDAQMAGAAACYAMSAIPHWAKHDAIRLLWPWSKAWWKPRSHRENLIRAGALIVAEIERIDRAALSNEGAGR